MKKIFKYKLMVSDGPLSAQLPVDARILHIQADGDQLIDIWAEVNPEADNTYRTFIIFGTGQPTTYPNKIHIGTVMTPHKLVWHVFELV